MHLWCTNNTYKNKEQKANARTHTHTQRIINSRKKCTHVFFYIRYFSYEKFSFNITYFIIVCRFQTLNLKDYEKEEKS